MMAFYSSGFFLWLLGVFWSALASAYDDRFASRRSAEEAVREALVWFLVWFPWREWLRLSKPGRHRSVVTA